jgi:hypothetical protein
VVVLAFRVHNSLVDLQKDTDIVKSQPFMVPPSGDLEIQVQIPPGFVTKSNQLNNGNISVDFMLLLAPRNGDLSKVTTMEKIHDIGGLELAANGVQGWKIGELLKKYQKQRH